jgi:hypothetical protein
VAVSRHSITPLFAPETCEKSGEYGTSVRFLFAIREAGANA